MADLIGRSGNILQGIGAFSVTPSDTVNLVDDAGNTKGYEDLAYTLAIGGDGDVKVMTLDGSIVTFSGRLAGTELPMLVTRVYSTGTTATLILAIKGK